ncbi:MAG TPA: histidine phosphatase family protein [Kofleriaceae bacterium]|nr:histidine phosphatase family protein [Kofleriaceae bacterium]
MGTLTLVRHGQASYGAADYDRLSERGILQAKALGRRWAETRLAADALVSGPMRRQVDTLTLAREAAVAAGHALPEPVVMPELAEYPAFELLARFLPRFVQERAELKGLLDGGAVAAERLALHDRALWMVIDAWTREELDCGDIETFGAFVARVRAGLERLMAAHPGRGRRIVAVTSGGPIGVACKLSLAIDALPTLHLWRMVRNASVTELLWRSGDFAWRPGDLSLLGFNHVDHLPTDLVTFK